jgi:hypothetical protein
LTNFQPFDMNGTRLNGSELRNAMKTKDNSLVSPGYYPNSTLAMVVASLLFGTLASPAQTGNYLYDGPGTYGTGWSGSEETITLSPGLYDITAYGAQGGGAAENTGNVYSYSGGFGAEMEGEFSFSTTVTLTLLVGGVGGLAHGGFTNNEAPLVYYWGGGGGGGSFVVNGNTPLVVAGGGGGAGSSGGGGNGSINAGSSGGGNSGGYPGYNGGGGGGYLGNGLAYQIESGGLSYLNDGRGGFGVGPSYYGEGASGDGGYGGGGAGVYGGGGGGGYSGGSGGSYFSVGSNGTGGYNGTGGGSYIDSSAITDITGISGVASPDGSPNGEIIITAVPEPTTLVLAGLSGLSVLLFCRWRRAQLS